MLKYLRYWVKQIIDMFFSVSTRKLRIKYIAHIVRTRWHLEYLLSDFLSGVGIAICVSYYAPC